MGSPEGPRVIAVMTDDAVFICPAEVICHLAGHVPARETSGALARRACRTRLCAECGGEGISYQFDSGGGQPSACASCFGSGEWEVRPQ
jgi:hypothetical protein